MSEELNHATRLAGAGAAILLVGLEPLFLFGDIATRRGSWNFDRLLMLAGTVLWAVVAPQVIPT